MTICVNGTEVSPPADARVSLLDLLREHLNLTGTKKGCDQGACGACTVLLDGDRVLSCLTLAAQAEGRDVRTVEGLSGGSDDLHPLQRAFVEHDGLQCGYCTPGQICSAIAMAEELRRGDPSYVTQDLTAGALVATRAEIRERMSGNLCRCGAQNGIIDAIETMLAETAA
ncbi:2Fe-2S iron-sulfur cluster-binding protein [Sphingobium abikonense]|uniref:2Fe-2S iron-sulfur cluster-binding protein n=1 Tax=Sphingobium abikonense TaxID=86193 RepID=UPI003514821A